MAATPSTTGVSNKLRRRWLQFSLRTLLLVMVPVACVCAWIGAELRTLSRQREAIAWVESLGGEVEIDEAATAANWRRILFGDRVPPTVVSVEFNPSYSTLQPQHGSFYFESPLLLDPPLHDIGRLAELKHLRHLSLVGATNPDLSVLAVLPQLETLDLGCTQIDNLTHLTSLQNLEELSLYRTQVTDLTPLAQLSNLRRLDLRNTKALHLEPLGSLQRLTQLRLGYQPDRVLYDWNRQRYEPFHAEQPIYGALEDIGPLANLQQLDVLDLSYTNASDISPLASLTQLKELRLFGTNVVDLRPLQNLRQLEELDLGNTPINDLTPLAQLTQLKRLGIVQRDFLYEDQRHHASFTYEQFEDLLRALPRCQIESDSPPPFPEILEPEPLEMRWPEEQIQLDLNEILQDSPHVDLGVLPPPHSGHPSDGPPEITDVWSLKLPPRAYSSSSSCGQRRVRR